MINYKTLSLADLKKDYLNTHGFVFQAPAPSKDSSIELLCKVLIDKQITNEYPKFVVKLDGNIHVFVYDQDFDCPTFMAKASPIGGQGVASMVGVKINTLHEFLRDN